MPTAAARSFVLTLILACLGVVAIAAPAARGQAKPFPDAWFFPDLPAGLKGLVGKPAPDLRLKTWIGEPVSLSKSKGKVVVVDFWATWCGPCMAAIPKNVDLVKKYKDQGLVFVGVHDANSGWDRAQGVVTDRGINYPVARDEDGGKSAEAYKLEFWPTYIVIDRAGVVRGAGLAPSHVEDAVKLLLAEPAPATPEAGGSGAGGLDPDYFFAGDRRADSLKAVEGKPCPPVAVGEWIGKALEPGDLKDRVVVLHFLSTGNAPSMKQAALLADLEKEIGPQGVVFACITRPHDDWERLKALAAEGKLPERIGRDATSREEAAGEAEGPGRGPGLTAAAFGVRYPPVTVVIDRAGVVRGAGVRPDKIKELAGDLLAEAPRPAPPATPEQAPPGR